MGEQVVVTSSSLDLSSLVCLCLPSIRSTDPAYSDFSLTTLRCRQLLFQFPGQLLACPRTDDSCVILVGGWCAVVLVLMMVFSCLL